MQPEADQHIDLIAEVINAVDNDDAVTLAAALTELHPGEIAHLLESLPPP